MNYDVYRPQIANLIADQQFRQYEMPANSDSSFWTDIGYTARRPFRTLQDYRNWIAQMRDIPRYFREQIAEMRAGEARGFTPPRVTLEGRDGSITAVTNAKPEDTLLYLPFKQMLATIPPAEQAALRAEAVKVIREQAQPAYAALLKFWDGEYVPRARTTLAAEDLPDGKAYYRQQIREYTTLDLAPEAIHQIGLAEVARLHAEMLAVMRETGFKGDFPAFLEYLRSDPRFYAKTPQELLNDAAWIAKEFDGKASLYFGFLPRARFAIVPVPADLAPFYTAGRGGPGVFLLNTYDLPHRPLYSLAALTLHESAPGHAFQIPLAMEDKSLPDFRRYTYISAYGEGWAVYCEWLGDEMGMYGRPTTASACWATRSGARRGWSSIPASIAKDGRAPRRSNICTTIPRCPSTRSRPRSTATSPGPARRSPIIWARWRSEMRAPRPRRHWGRGSISAPSTTRCCN